MTSDRLEQIKTVHTNGTLIRQADVTWLIQEVERLRLSDAILRRDVEELRASRIADFEHLADYCKKLVSALQSIDPTNPAIESVRRVGRIMKENLGILRERNVSGR